MSLINKMLQDLEARQAAGAEALVSHHVRALPPEERAPAARVVAAAAATLVVLAASGAFFLLRDAPAHDDGPRAAGALAPARVATRSTEALAATGVAATVAPASLPALAPRLPSASAEAAPAGPADPPERLDDYGLKVATSLASPPLPLARVEKPAAAPAPARARPETASAAPPPESRGDSRRNVGTDHAPVSVAEPKTAAVKPVPAGTSPSPVPRPGRTGDGPPRIEKQPREPTARERASAEYRLAVALLSDGRPGAAAESLRAVLRADPAHADARLMLSNLHVEQRQLPEARSTLEQGLALDAAQPRLAMPLARIQVELGDSAAAAETLARAAPAATANAEYRGFHAAVLQRLGRHAEAAAEFHAALRLLPEAGVWWMGLGLSLESEGQRAAAREALRRARETGRLSPELDRFVAGKLETIR